MVEAFKIVVLDNKFSQKYILANYVYLINLIRLICYGRMLYICLYVNITINDNYYYNLTAQ